VNSISPTPGQGDQLLSPEVPLSPPPMQLFESQMGASEGGMNLHTSNGTENSAEGEAENDVDTAAFFDTLSLASYEIGSLPLSVYNSSHSYPTSAYPAWPLDNQDDDDDDDGEADEDGADVDNDSSTHLHRDELSPYDEHVDRNHANNSESVADGHALSVVHRLADVDDEDESDDEEEEGLVRSHHSHTH